LVISIEYTEANLTVAKCCKVAFHGRARQQAITVSIPKMNKRPVSTWGHCLKFDSGVLGVQGAVISGQCFKVFGLLRKDAVLVS